jgi:predicted metalloprotease with PDZ domain
MMVGAVTAGSEAERAGLQVGDTILEIQGKAAGQESRQELARLAPGDPLTLKVRGRRGADRELKWKVGSRQESFYQVKDLEKVTAEQRSRRAVWLKGESEAESHPAEPNKK